MSNKSLRGRVESVMVAATFAFSIYPYFLLAGFPPAVSVLPVVPVFIGVLAIEQLHDKT